MCGIFAYIWDKEAKPYLINGLKNLEYRGYDSSWICVLNGKNEVYIEKAVGKVSALASKVEETAKNTGDFKIGIAHTRWATHGWVTVPNTHPHSSESGRFHIVHNWIIENFIELRKMLEKEYNFYSETDSEVVAKLFEKLFDGNLLTTAQKVVKKIEWAYGIAVIDKENPDEIVGLKLGSPLVIGLKENEYFISSDPNALTWVAEKFIALDDNEMVHITRDGYKILSAGVEISKDAEEIEGKEDELGMDGYAHYMLKEIHESAKVFYNSISGRINFEENIINSNTLEELGKKDFDRIEIIASGTSNYAGSTWANWFEELAWIPTTVHVSAEFKYKRQFINDKTLYVFISQSWETADVVECLKLVKAKGGLTFWVVNVVGSTIARMTDLGMYTHCWREIWVASTKAFTGNLWVLLTMALFLGNKRDLDYNKYRELLAGIKELPNKIEKVLENIEDVKSLAEKYSKYSDMFFLGRNLMFPIAMEGSLKMKEITYKHSESYPSGELKHGPLSLVDENFPSVLLNPKGKHYDKNISTLKEVKARDGMVIWVVTEWDSNIKEYDDVIIVPEVAEELAPVVVSPALCLFAYYTALHLGREIDKPRNLAKSVTVE